MMLFIMLIKQATLTKIVSIFSMTRNVDYIETREWLKSKVLAMGFRYKDLIFLGLEFRGGGELAGISILASFKA